MVDIQHTDLTGSGQLHPPLAKGFTGAAASYTPDNADELVVKTDVTPHILYRTTGTLAGNVTQIGSVAIEAQDEGGSLTTAATTFNFVGAGVTATEASDVVTVTIPGGGGGGSIEVEDEGVSLTTAVTLFNFVGDGVTATEPVADEITVTVPGNPLEVSDEGISLTTAAIELDFVGAGVTATEAAGVVTVTIPGGGGSSITVEDEGTPLTTAVTLFDFAGAGVTVTEPVADQVLVTIPGNPLEVEDEAVSLSTAVTKINFAGAGVTATEPVSDEILVTIPGGTSGLEVEDEGVSLSTAVSKINFAGAGVTATEPVADEILVTIPGGGGGSTRSKGWASLGSNQTGVSNGDQIEWDTEDQDNDTMVDVGGANPEDITINTAGDYLVTAYIALDTSAVSINNVSASLQVNASTVAAQKHVVPSDDTPVFTISHQDTFSVSDTIRITIFFLAGGSITALASSKIRVTQLAD